MGIYTRKGDTGATRLRTGDKVGKDALRVNAYGALDELQSQLGVTKGMMVWDDGTTIIEGIQEDIFWMSAELSVAPGKPVKQARRV